MSVPRSYIEYTRLAISSTALPQNCGVDLECEDLDDEFVPEFSDALFELLDAGSVLEVANLKWIMSEGAVAFLNLHPSIGQLTLSSKHMWYDSVL